MNFDFKDGLVNIDVYGEYIHIVYNKKEGETIDEILARTSNVTYLNILDNGEVKDQYQNITLSRITVPAHGNRIRLTFILEGGE